MSADSAPPSPVPSDSGAAWQERNDPEHRCRIYQRGLHHKGSFVRVYVPYSAEQPHHKPLRLILYLHGFALCLPSFYQAHLFELVAQGWIVVFPDFQCSGYDEEPLDAAGAAGRPAPDWWPTTRRLLRQGAKQPLRRQDMPEAMAGAVDGAEGAEGAEELALASTLPELQVGDLRRVLLPWLLIRLVLGVIGWFRRSYARNLSQLISTVLLSLAFAPKHWLRHAQTQTEAAWNDLASLPRYSHWGDGPDAFYGFGHSLGGLLSLSLPSRQADNAPPSRFQPKVILAADPATSTEMGIPSFAIALLKLFHAPFTAEPLAIQQTGPRIRQPTVIMHGLDDTLVPPQLWAVQGGGGAFASIGAPAKALYFASSNRQLNPSLVAFHNQAVTSTQYYDDALFESFGGVKNGPNPYNTSWIWPALHALFAAGIAPDQLLAHLPADRPFTVSTDPPPPKRRLGLGLIAAALLVVAVLLLWRRAG